MSKRRYNISDMTIHEQLAKIAEQMCDKYCKFPTEDISQEELVDNHCTDCPLMRLV